MKSRWQLFWSDNSGGVAVTTALGLVMLLGAAALVVDLGHLYVVHTEVQKAAEAGAYAGARALKDNTANWNWTNALATATDTVKGNKVDNASLDSYTAPDPVNHPMVEMGYWDSSWTTGIPQGPPAYGHLLGYSNPAAYTPASDKQFPAVKVTVAKGPGGSGVSAPLSTLFASVIGTSSMNATGSAVASLPAPTAIPPGDAFPFAIPWTYVVNNWDKDPPVNFTVGSTQHDSSGGQWTSFKETDNGANYIDGLILYGNPTWLVIGDRIYIQSGERGSIYNTVESQFAAHPNKIYMVAVVPDGFQTGAYTDVKGYVAYKITGVNGSGNDPYVTGHFIPNFVDPKASGAGGPHFGTTLPPKLVQ